MPERACIFGTSLARKFARVYQPCASVTTHQATFWATDLRTVLSMTPAHSLRHPHVLHLPSFTDVRGTQGEDVARPVLREPHPGSSPAPGLLLSKLQKLKGCVLHSTLPQPRIVSEIQTVHLPFLCSISTNLLVASDRKHNSNWLKGGCLRCRPNHCWIHELI